MIQPAKLGVYANHDKDLLGSTVARNRDKTIRNGDMWNVPGYVTNKTLVLFEKSFVCLKMGDIPIFLALSKRNIMINRRISGVAYFKTKPTKHISINNQVD